MRNSTWIGIFTVFVFTVILDFLIGWPSALIAGIIAGFVVSTLSRPFWIGFAGAGIAWFLLAILPVFGSPSWLLAGKLVQIIMLPSEFAIVMFLLTGIIGGLLGGLGVSNSAAGWKLIKRIKTYFYKGKRV